MRRKSNYKIVGNTEDRILIADLGPWDEFVSVTNNAENVLEELIKAGVMSVHHRLFYLDSEGECAEILHKLGIFRGFSHVAKEALQ